jgi:hypothetical protein
MPRRHRGSRVRDGTGEAEGRYDTQWRDQIPADDPADLTIEIVMYRRAGGLALCLDMNGRLGRLPFEPAIHYGRPDSHQEVDQECGQRDQPDRLEMGLAQPTFEFEGTVAPQNGGNCGPARDRAILYT